MLKQKNVIEIIIPRYWELRVQNIWPLVKEISELKFYFLDYSEKQLPDRKFMFTVFATSKLKGLIAQERKNRAWKEDRAEGEFLYIKDNLMNEINQVFTQKSKYGAII